MGSYPENDNVAMAEACDAAKTFEKLYYDIIDNRRDRLDGLLQPDVVLCWNGHRVVGKDLVKKFIQDLPKSNHEVLSMDVQPMKYAVPNQTTFALKIGGFACYGGQERGRRTSFAHSFIITSVGTSWKIVSETYRFLDPEYKFSRRD